MAAIALVAGLIVILLIALLWVSSRYKRCPSDRVLVIYGRIGGHGQSARCLHGGGALIWPVIQGYAFMDLTPIPIEIKLQGALSQQNIRVNTPATFTVGVSRARRDAERRRADAGAEPDGDREPGPGHHLRPDAVVIATMPIEEINADREKLITNITESLEIELRKVGLRLINVNIQDITDESGYIDALGREAAARAINEPRSRWPSRSATAISGPPRPSGAAHQGCRGQRHRHRGGEQVSGGDRRVRRRAPPGRRPRPSGPPSPPSGSPGPGGPGVVRG